MSHPPVLPVSALFVSGLNLGTRDCRSDLFLDCLKRYEPKTVYLAGDMIGYREWKRNFKWPQSHNDVIQKLLRQARRGSKVYYIPGDRDGFMRHYGEALLGGIEMVGEVRHQTVDGRSFLVLHGDEFDLVAPSIGLIGRLGKGAVAFAVGLSRLAEIVVRLAGFSLHGQHYGRNRRGEERFAEGFATTAAASARARGFDGIICGHLPHALARRIDSVEVLNTGDWRKAATILVEHEDGRFETVAMAPEGAFAAPVLVPRPA